VSSARAATTALAVTLLIQAFTSLAATATAVLAPEIGRAIGMPPKLIGVFVGLIYLGAMMASLASGSYIERYGPIRVSQVCILLCACGVALVCGPTWALPLAPVLIGIGYGPITPASSHVLARTASPRRMALTFSIKQTGVPLGAALAGALLPMLALGYGWRTALLTVAGAGVLIALLAQPTRAALDVGLARDHRVSLGRLFAPLMVVARTPKLVELTVTGFVYAATQICLMSFLVVYLTEALGQSLVTAGIALTIATTGGIVGRISWGAVADRWLPPRLMLGALGLVAGVCGLATASFGAHWSPLPALLVCAMFGASAIGWNGVQLAEVARHAPPGQAGAITGASGFVTFAGVVVGPPVFALLVAVTGSYGVGFAVLGTASLACATWLLTRRS
jgi:MFS family permease